VTLVSCPTSGLIAILRGITPDDAVAIGEVLVDEGYSALEVPLNSPDPFTSIARLRAALPDGFAIGAGTVLSTADVARSSVAGSSIIVSPNTDPEVIQASVALGLASYPGVATATEAFAAVRAGALSLKIFPSDVVGIAAMTAWRAVLPPDVEMLPVGGIDASNLADWARAGAGGAGIGSALYRPGDTPDDVRRHARETLAAWSAGFATALPA
jgi:2-dehydro-3-deoxyphosphogalactonate aldolase